jgi:hypothetical protein
MSSSRAAITASVIVMLVLLPSWSDAASCVGLEEDVCIGNCGCSVCYNNATFFACAESISSCPAGSQPRIPLRCDYTVLGVLVFDALCLFAWHIPGIVYGVVRLVRPQDSSGQRRWFWTQVGFVLVICSMFALPLSLFEHLKIMRLDGDASGVSSLYEATLFMFAMCMVLHDLVHIVEHEDGHAKGQPSRLLNIAFIVVHAVFAVISAFLCAITLLSVRWGATPDEVQQTLDVLDGVISVLVALVTLGDFAYATVTNVMRLGPAPVRIRAIIIGVPALPTLAVVVLVPLFFSLDGDQLVLHLLITLCAIGTTRTLRIMTRASKFAAVAHDDHEASPLLPGAPSVNRVLPSFLSSMVTPRPRIAPRPKSAPDYSHPVEVTAAAAAPSPPAGSPAGRRPASDATRISAMLRTRTGAQRRPSVPADTENPEHDGDVEHSVL